MANQKDILDILYDQGKMKVKDISNHFPETSKNSISMTLKRMVSKGIVVKDSNYDANYDLSESTRYRLKKKKLLKKKELDKLEKLKEERENKLNKEKLLEESIEDFLHDYDYQDAVYSNHLEIDLSQVLKHNPKIIDELHDNTKNTINMIEKIANEKFIEDKEVDIKFFNVPEEFDVPLRQAYKSENTNKLVQLKGLITSYTTVMQKAVNLLYECSDCGNKINLKVKNENKNKPKFCKCGNSKNFELIDKELKDHLVFSLQEPFEQVADTSKNINCILQGKLDNEQINKIKSGKQVKIIGIPKSEPIDKKKHLYKNRIYINNIILLDKDWDDQEITEEDEEKIKEISNSEITIKKLRDSVAPYLKGKSMDIIKESSIIYLAKAPDTNLDDNNKSRGNIHILFIGNPSTGKTELLDWLKSVFPKVVSATGSQSSGVGLTATVTKDEDFEGWKIVPGPVVLGNNGYCVIDEMDKMSKEDADKLLEAMEQRRININKADIHTELPAATSIIAGANPKLGSYDEMEDIIDQLPDFSKPLFSRFDLKFALRPGNKEEESIVADEILNRDITDYDKEKEISNDLLKKYIYKARQKNPFIRDEHRKMIKDFYINLNDLQNKNEILISRRNLRTIINITKAYARLNLRDEVEEEDVRNAINLFNKSLESMGKTLGEDISEITGEIPRSTKVKNKLNELKKTYNNKVPNPDIVSELSVHFEEKDKIISKLSEKGWIAQIEKDYSEVLV